MVFGAFDGIHDGHRAMLREARALGDQLIVVLAQDHIIEHLKGHLPRVNLMERFEHLKKEDGVDRIVVGDPQIGMWGAIRLYRPDIVAIGYDQAMLKERLEADLDKLPYIPKIKMLSSYEPNTTHSSLLNR